MCADDSHQKGIPKMKRILAVLTVLIILSSLCGCSCDNSDYYSTPNVDPKPSVVVQSGAKDEISAPVMGKGEYTMLCTFRQTALYYDAEYGMETDWDMKSWYDFTAKETEKGLKLKFTIARKSYVYSSNDDSTVVFDTADESTRSLDTEIYFDMIGHGFTVDLDKNYKVVSVGGTKELYSKVDGASELMGESEIRAIAEELLLTLPETVTKNTVITHSQTVDSQTKMEMKYSVSKISDSMISFDMKPVSEYGLPEGEYGDGYSIEYKGAADYKGSLSIMNTDRFLQSSTNSITYYSEMKLSDGTGVVQKLDGITTVTDSCQITAK